LDPQVDEDHRTLFWLLDRLATHRREFDLDGLNPLLDQLIEYTFAHFTREEAVMQAVDYPELPNHADLHLSIRRALIESVRQVAKGDLAIHVFIQQTKERFTRHFEADDLSFVAWQQHHQGQGMRV
jgi:hemerythrin-like metal-binding protein